MNSKNRSDGIRLFVMSFCIAILILVSANLITICLLKMENTISAKPYNILLINQEKDEKINITLFNQKNILDFSRINAVKRQIARFEIVISPLFRCLEFGLKTVFNAANTEVCKEFLP